MISPLLFGTLFWLDSFSLIHSLTRPTSDTPLLLHHLPLSPSHSQTHLEDLVKQWKTCPESIPVSRNLDHTIHLVGVAVSWRRGSRIRNSEMIVKNLDSVLSSSFLVSPSLLSTSLHLVSSLLLLVDVPECHANSSRLLRLLCSRGRCCEEGEVVLGCFRELSQSYHSFLKVCFNPFTPFFKG